MSSIGSGGSKSWQASFLQAVGTCDERRVRDFVQEGSLYTDVLNDSLRIALLRAVGRGHEPLTRLLLAEGADVNVASDGEILPLHRAAEQGRDQIVQILLDHGASTEKRDKFKRTPIFAAAQRNHRKTLRLLLQAGADVNVRDENNQNVLLRLASEASEKSIKWGTEIIEILLNTSIDLEATDAEGRTVLLWAAATGKERMIHLLLTRSPGAKANVHATNNRGKTALHLAAESKTERLALVEILLDNDANVSARSDGGWTPLLNAAERGHANIVSLLLRSGANVNAATSSGMTPLHWSARNGHVDVVKVLILQPGLRKDRKDSFEETAMLQAAQNGHIDILKMLSPAHDGAHLSEAAQKACEGFQATVVDFGMEHRPMNHKKFSVHDVLYGWDSKLEKPMVPTLVRNISAKPKFRWIHFPCNNMSWIETLLTKRFIEDSASDVDGFKAIEKISGQRHRGPTVHSHFMRPLCQRLQPTGKNIQGIHPIDNQEEVPNSISKTPVPTIVTPDKENGILNKPTVPINSPKSKDAPTDAKHRKNSKPKVGSMDSAPSKTAGQTKAAKSIPDMSRQRQRSHPALKPVTSKMDRNGNLILFMPYLHYETHRRRKLMSDAIDRATLVQDRGYKAAPGATCDELVIQAYLASTHDLHIRRTLDQFYYHAISTEGRDTDQVIYRYTRDKGKEKKVFMVDQLWCWVLGSDLIITSFPQRWEQPKDDPLNVLNGIIEDVNSKTRPPVRSVHDLAVLITGRCIGVFDRHRIGSDDYQFLDMFESSIGEVTNKETELFKKFNDASVAAARWLSTQRRQGKSQISNPPSNGHDLTADPTFVDTLLDIGEETALLAETKDIRDELNMISMVLQHQSTILQDLTNALLEELKGNHNQQKQAEIRKRILEQQKVIAVHLKDVERMDKQAEGIYTSLTHLLDLKQKHANAIEARFARDQAAFTGRQGQTIMVFTIVTIVFLPMSFIAAVFAIPVRDFPHQNGTPSMPFSYVSKIMFGVGLAISIPLIAVAFAVDDLGHLVRRIMSTLIFWRSRPGHSTASSSEGKQLDSIDEERSKYVQPGRRSGDTYRRLSIYETDDGGHVRSWPIRRSFALSRDKSWENKSRQRNTTISTVDLETGPRTLDQALNRR